MASVDSFIVLGDKVKADDAARRIQEEEIDILVDLNGHSKGGRPDILALKPAPVRALFLGRNEG